ncbi:hypothetical protein MHU86_18430 [Fragilaria crotonensis]|nr:hypothetical protein MHU86_18430 [Fragilaria crotonensis]
MAEVPSLSPVSRQQGGVPMDKAYLFRDGMDEFTPPPGTKVNRQFRSQVRVFYHHPRAVSEFPLHMFSSWFQDLPLSKIMTQNEREDSNEIWQFKVVTLYPTRVQTNKAEATRFKWATEAARQFYSTSFNSTEADLSSIDRAVNSDPSIMIVGRPLGKKMTLQEICHRVPRLCCYCMHYISKWNWR